MRIRLLDESEPRSFEAPLPEDLTTILQSLEAGK
jgi:hypothetical protein